MKKIGLSIHYTENEKGNENAVRVNTKSAIEEISPLSTHYMPQ
jgi:hypothetical protein